MTEGDRAGALELACRRLQAELKADGFLEEQGKPVVTEFRLGEQYRLGIYEGELTFPGGEKELVSVQTTETGFCLGER